MFIWTKWLSFKTAWTEVEDLELMRALGENHVESVYGSLNYEGNIAPR